MMARVVLAFMRGDNDMASNQDKQTPPENATKRSELEGEGSYSAAKSYDDDAERFARSGKATIGAAEARNALAGDEAESLARAEEEGKARSKGEDPALRESKKDV